MNGNASWHLHDIATINIVRLYCNVGGSPGNNIVRNNVGDEGGSGVPKQKEVCANNRIDLCTEAYE